MSDFKLPDWFAYRPNTHDGRIAEIVAGPLNEYKLPDRFEPTDHVLDIGAHVGAATFACWQRGCRNIDAYEPCAANFDILTANVNRMTGDQKHIPLRNREIRCWNFAIWKSLDGGYRTPLLYQPSPDAMNTGGGDVLASLGEPVLGDGLDNIIKGPVRLLKLDCEYSEFPILLTSKKLGMVAEIACEVHSRGEGSDRPIPLHAAIDGYHAWTPDVLKEHLAKHGFDVELAFETEQISKLFAKQKT